MTGQVAAGRFVVNSMTSDGYAVVTDLDKHTVEAVSLANGKAQVITQATSASPLLWGYDTGTVLVGQPGSTNDSGQLTVWTAAGGAHVVSANAQLTLFTGGPVVSRDGQRIAYWDNIDATTRSLTLDTPTHSAPRVLVRASTCNGVALMAPKVLVASYCIAATGGGSQGQVAAFDLDSGAQTVLQDNADLGFFVDQSGSHAVVYAASTFDANGTQTSAGQATLVTLDGAQRYPFDGNSIAKGENGWFQGTDFVYVADGGALKRIGADGQTSTLVASGAAGPLGGSGTTVAYYTKYDQATNNSDINLVDLSHPGAPVVVNSDGTAQLTGFSADGKQVLFYTGVNLKALTGTLNVMPTTGAQSQVLGTGASRVFGDVELAGERVLFNDGYVAPTNSASGQINLKLVDLAHGASPTSVLTAIDPAFFITPDFQTIVYTISNDPSKAGLYVLPIPN
jgi:hypothetical protein